MKKKFSALLACIMAVTMITSVRPMNCTSAVEGTTQFMALKNDTETVIEVPEYSDNLLVTSIIVSNCSALKSITIPKSVEYITIEGCYALENVSVDSDNENLCSIDGVVYDKKAENMLYYPPAKPSKFFAIPESAIVVKEYFSKFVEDVIVTENVDEMGACFNNCGNLNSVTFLNDSLNPNYLSSNSEDLRPWYIASFKYITTENIVKVYVPDNKFDVYKEMVKPLGENISFELVPLSQRPVDLIGDTNLDGQINTSDVEFLGRYLTNKRKSVSMSADVNQDSDVNVFDMIAARRLINSTP